MAPPHPDDRPGHPLEALFGLLLRVLPPSVRADDTAEIRATLRDQVAGAGSARERWRVAGRALRRLPGVVVAEWMGWLGIGRGPAVGPPARRKGDGAMGSWSRNLRYAVRSLWRAPTFAVSTVLLVGLGVGTVTTVFTVVDGVLLRPLAYPAADRLVYMTNGSHNGPTLSRLDGVEAFELWTATSVSSVNLTRADGDPLRLRRAETTPEFFTLFGGRPLHGRLLVDADRDDVGIAVLAYPFWRDVFGAEPGVVGTTMQIDGEPLEIVGVLSEDFVHPRMVLGDAVDFYRPVYWSRPELQDPGYHAHSVTARLRPGVTLAQADQEIGRVETDVAAAEADYYSDGPPDWPLQTLHERTVQDVRSGLLLLLGAVGLLMLVACANVAHLFMARGLSRGREMAIRRAMGARPLNLLGQLSAESVAVGVAGGLIGLALARVALALFGPWTVHLPRGADVAIDLTVLGLCIVLATATAVVFGLFPAFRTLATDVGDGLRAGGRGVTGGRGVRALRGGLVVFEVAISLVLVASAGLLMRSFLAVTAIDPGVDSADVWMLPLNPTNVESPDQYRNRMEAVRTALLAVPGVRSATYGIEAPFEHVGGNMCCWANGVRPPDQPDAEPLRVSLHPVSEGYFETMGTELVAGRLWNPSEATASPRGAVISEGLAIRVFGSAEAAVGREAPDWVRGVRVVGVAEPTRHYGLDQSHDYALYLPIEALPFPITRATFALRTAGSPDGLARMVREAVWSAEPDLPVPAVTTLEGWIDRSSAARRFGSVLFAAFGAVALLLAAAGLYGTLLYAVGQRRQELGIRLALGAGRRRIQADVIRRGLAQAAIGVAAGGAAAWFVGRLMEAFLFGVSATDPLALGAAAVVLLLTAAVASWFPAYRAGQTDPLETLKAE